MASSFHPAGTISGHHAGTTALERGFSLQRLVGEERMRRPPRTGGRAPPNICAGDGRDLDVLLNSTHPGLLTTSGGRAEAAQTRCIFGYTGHVAGKVAENVHGTTFKRENTRATLDLPVREMRRSFSSPETLYAPGAQLRASKQGHMSVAPRVPGYAGNVPGKLSESVHGTCFGNANEAAQTLRTSNPNVDCEGWMKRGHWPSDRMATYKYAGNCKQRIDMQSLFTEPQEAEANAMSRKLGHTFGLEAPKANHYKPGDRHLHSHFAGQMHRERDPAAIAAMKPAGQPTHALFLEQERCKLHNVLCLTNGNQRAL